MPNWTVDQMGNRCNSTGKRLEDDLDQIRDGDMDGERRKQAEADVIKTPKMRSGAPKRPGRIKEFTVVLLELNGNPGQTF